MLELDPRQIRMDQRAADKSEALALLGAMLEEDGLVASGYLAGLPAGARPSPHDLHRLPFVVEPKLLWVPSAAEGQQQNAAAS